MSACGRLAAGLAFACAVALPAARAAAPPNPSKPSPERTLLRCEPVYMPARSTWVREVELVGQSGRLSEVRIDGLAVNSFAVRDTTVLTSQDNERIQINFSERTWTSDFRGLASGQGRCELIEP